MATQDKPTYYVFDWADPGSPHEVGGVATVDHRAGPFRVFEELAPLVRAATDGEWELVLYETGSDEFVFAVLHEGDIERAGKD